MGTALDLAYEALDVTVSYAETEGIELPDVRYPQLGSPIIACPSVITTVTGFDTFVDPNVPPGALPGCAPMQVGTVTIYIAREYACTSDDGIDDPEAVYEISQIMAADGQLLWAVLNTGLQVFMGPDNASINWTIDGGLCYTTGTCTRGIV